MKRAGAAALLAVHLTACASSSPPRGFDVEAEKSALMKIDTQFSKMAQERGLAEAFVAYSAPDATMMPMNENAVTGHREVRKQFEGMPAETTLVWKPFRADVAKSGDLGYTLGTYEFHAMGPGGQPVTRYGKYCSVWKKQPHGSWKWVVDIGNSSPAPK